jgi:hypothetical protein
VNAKVQLIWIIQVPAASVRLFFQFRNLLIQEGTGFFNLVNIVCIAQTAFAT